jgi:hypothetical protein
MTTIHQKHQILESLSTMDQAQTEKVLHYIKGLLTYSKKETAHEKLKREALREIRMALRSV